MRVQIPVLVYVSRMTDGTVHRDVFPEFTGRDESTAYQRAMSTMMSREGIGIEVARWREYRAVITYAEEPFSDEQTAQ